MRGVEGGMSTDELALRIITTRRFSGMKEYRDYILEMAIRGLNINSDHLLRHGHWTLKTCAEGEVVETRYEIIGPENE